MNEIEEIKSEILIIKDRNKRVEIDKAWEASWTRRICVLVLTYIVVVVFFVSSKLPSPYVNAIVPSLAFMISTSSLPIVKKLWQKVIK